MIAKLRYVIVCIFFTNFLLSEPEKPDLSKEVNKSFQEAVLGGDSNLVSSLLYWCQIELEAKDKKGRTALHNAARFGYHEIVGELIKYNADIHAQDNKNRKPLYYAEKWNKKQKARTK